MMMMQSSQPPQPMYYSQLPPPPQAATPTPFASPPVLPPPAKPKSSRPPWLEHSIAPLHQELPLLLRWHSFELMSTFCRIKKCGIKTWLLVGDKVHKGQVICIIEAMKLMNEVETINQEQ